MSKLKGQASVHEGGGNCRESTLPVQPALPGACFPAAREPLHHPPLRAHQGESACVSPDPALS